VDGAEVVGAPVVWPLVGVCVVAVPDAVVVAVFVPLLHAAAKIDSVTAPTMTTDRLLEVFTLSISLCWMCKQERL